MRRVGAAVLLGLGAPGRGTVAELTGFAVLLVAFPIATRYGVSGAAWALCAAAAVSIAVQGGFVARALRRLP